VVSTSYIFNEHAGEADMQTPDNDNSEIVAAEDLPRKSLSPAAQRALEEAEARRKANADTNMPLEIGGRGGADPARFGDWEINGRAIDF
jgi:hypothetical protein